MSEKWHYAKGNQKFGPVNSTDLKRLAAECVLQPDDLVWKEGQAKWVRASAVRGLFPSNSPAPSPSSVVPTTNPTSNPRLTSPRALAEKTTGQAAMMVRKATFREWYSVTLGRQWLIVQAALWVFYGFLWIPIWWLSTRHKIDTSQLTSKNARESPDELRRQQELEKLERLQGNGMPFIEGEVVRLRGVSGLAKGMCSLRFQPQDVVLQMATGKQVALRYDQIKSLQIAGQGKVVESVDNAFVGGGFGLGGALQGAAQAMLLNAAISALTKNERFECELALEWDTGEVVMMNREYLPEVVGKVLHPFIEKIPS
jgi:hypothetical protein